MKTSFDKLLDVLLPDRIAERRRVEGIYNRAGWLKFSQARLVASGHRRPSQSPFRSPEVRDESIRQSSPAPDSVTPVAVLRETPADESIDAPPPGSTASEAVPLETTADESADVPLVSSPVSQKGQTPEDVAKPALADLSDRDEDEELPVLEDQPEQRQDLSHLLGFKELAIAARQTVRDLTVESRPEPAARSKKPKHWMTLALSHAGIPRANDLSLTPEMDSDEIWGTAREWCRVSSSEIAEAVARQFCLKSVELKSLDISRIPDIPDSLLRQYRAVPVAQGSRYLILAISDPSDPDLDRDFSFVTGKSVALTVAPPEAIAETLWNTYGWIL